MKEYRSKGIGKNLSSLLPRVQRILKNWAQRTQAPRKHPSSLSIMIFCGVKRQPFRGKNCYVGLCQEFFPPPPKK